MTQTQKTNAVQWITVTLVALMILGALFVLPGIVDTKIQEGVDSIDVPTAPTAEEIVALVDIPTAEDIATLIDIPNLRNDNFDDILEGIYPDEVEDLEEDCINDLEYEYLDDVISEIKDLIEENLDEEIKDIVIVDWNQDDDYDFSVINLGLDDEEDRAGEIEVTFRVEYREVFGDDDKHYEKVLVEASCSDWDKDDNEFDDLSIAYSLAQIV